MRNPERIAPFVLKIAEIWQEYVPDWRFGQLMSNFISTYGDPFYWEEDRFLQNFEKYLINITKGEE